MFTTPLVFWKSPFHGKVVPMEGELRTRAEGAMARLWYKDFAESRLNQSKGASVQTSKISIGRYIFNTDAESRFRDLKFPPTHSAIGYGETKAMSRKKRQRNRSPNMNILDVSPMLGKLTKERSGVVCISENPH